MRCRLGSLTPLPDLAQVAVLLHQAAAAGRGSRMQRFGEIKRGQSDVPDLLEVLPASHPMRALAGEVQAGLADLRGVDPVQLTHCEWHEDRFVAVAGTWSQRGRAVKRGDLLCAGFALFGEDGEVPRLLPRIYRVVCANGALVPLGNHADLLAQGMTVRQALEMCCRRAPLADFTRVAAQLTRLPIDDPTGVLWQHPIDPAVRPRQVLDEFRRGGDRTAWGLVNAITAMARELADLRLRLRVEEQAGELAWLLANSPLAGATRRLGALAHAAP